MLASEFNCIIQTRYIKWLKHRVWWVLLLDNTDIFTGKKVFYKTYVFVNLMAIQVFLFSEYLTSSQIEDVLTTACCDYFYNHCCDNIKSILNKIPLIYPDF